MAFAFMAIGCVINYPCIVAIQAQTFAEYVFQGFSIDIDDQRDYYSKKLLEIALVGKVTSGSDGVIR